MACIGRCISGNILHWESVFDDVFTVNQNEPACLGYLFPDENQPGWGIRNIYTGERQGNLDLGAIRRPGQYRVVAEHRAQDALYEKMKIAALIIGGVVVSVAFAAAMVTIALVVAELTGTLFIVLSLLFAELIGESAILGCVIVITALLALGFELSNAFAALVAGVAAIWTKEIIPNLQRGVHYIRHMDTEARDLEFRGAAERVNPPAPQINLAAPELALPQNQEA